MGTRWGKSTAKEYVILSPEDLDLKQFVIWLSNRGYIGLWLPGSSKAIYLHRFIIDRMGIEIPEDHEVDHINRLKFDNRRENLRVVTHAENNANNSALGVYFKKDRNKWCASVKRNYKTIHLGNHPTKEEALLARKAFLDKETNEQERPPN